MPLIGSGHQCVWATSVVHRPWVQHCLDSRLPALLGRWAPSRLLSRTSHALDDHLRQVGLVQLGNINRNQTLRELTQLPSSIQAGDYIAMTSSELRVRIPMCAGSRGKPACAVITTRPWSDVKNTGHQKSLDAGRSETERRREKQHERYKYAVLAQSASGDRSQRRQR